MILRALTRMDTSRKEDNISKKKELRSETNKISHHDSYPNRTDFPSDLNFVAISDTANCA